MLDPAGDTPTAPPPASLLIALRDGASLRAATPDHGPGLRAEPNGAGGYHVGARTLVTVAFGDAGSAPITWARFAADNADLGKGELRVILADLAATGEHRGGGGAGPEFTVRVVPAVAAPEPSPARMTAEAELARLDAAYCQLAQARRRYAADTACNAWSLEQAAKDVTRAAEAVAGAFARRAELA